MNPVLLIHFYSWLNVPFFEWVWTLSVFLTSEQDICSRCSRSSEDVFVSCLLFAFILETRWTQTNLSVWPLDFTLPQRWQTSVYHLVNHLTWPINHNAQIKQVALLSVEVLHGGNKRFQHKPQEHWQQAVISSYFTLTDAFLCQLVVFLFLFVVLMAADSESDQCHLEPRDPSLNNFSNFHSHVKVLDANCR